MKSLVQKMKSVWLVLLVGLLAGAPGATQAQQTEVSFQVFYDELAPHGRWFLHPRYGDVWAPNVQGEFTPYLTNGYWTVTQYGNTWVSNYDWGWATFHYGRWQFDEFEGWFWIPDTAWAPAWVVWRNGGGYYGWAPMSPGINFSLSFNSFSGIPNFYWSFVPQAYVWRPYVYRYCAPRYRNVYIVNNTTYVTHNTYNNITYNYYTGPSHIDITHVTNRPVVVHHVENGNSPGRPHIDHDKIVIYRPNVSHHHNAQGNNGNGGNGNNGSGNGGNNGNGQGNDGNGQGGNGNSGGSGQGNSGGNDQGNNGHGNGDQNAPGNSGDHNNGENSENSGQGNSGDGKGNSGSRWSGTSTDRTNGYQRNGESQNLNRNETNNDVRSYRSTEIRKPAGYSSGGNRSTGNTNRTGVSSSTSGSSNSGGNNRSYTPSRTSSSGGGGRSFTPSSSGNSGGSNRSFSPTRSSSGGSKSVTPSRSSGGSSKTNSPSGNRSRSKSKN